jgi:hypothetical protein
VAAAGTIEERLGAHLTGRIASESEVRRTCNLGSTTLR